MANNSGDDDNKILRMLHHRTMGLRGGDSVAPPIQVGSTYHLPSEPDPNRIYGRDSNPTVQSTEDRLAVLEDATTTLFASGMAAYMAMFLATVKAKERVLILSDGYYHVRTLLTEILSGLDIRSETCSARDIADYPLDGFRMVIAESPTNPTLDCIDITQLCTHAKPANCLVVVDNTICTPILQQPLALGADIVVTSDTKVMGGHSDLLLGHVSSTDSSLMKRVRRARTLAGAIPGPFDAWLLARSLDTLELRLERMCDNAMAVALLLKASPNVVDVRYPGLEGDPSFAIAQSQMRHPGYLISVTFASQTLAETFIEHTKIFIPATSFGSVHCSADRRARWGDDVPDGFLRLSIGCEPKTPLLEAIQIGLSADA